MSRRRILDVPIPENPYVLRLSEHRPPLDWTAVFGRPGPVEVEIGSGKGLFLAQANILEPETRFLGVEKAGKYFRHAVDRIYKLRAENVRVCEADAFDLLDRWIPEASVDGVHVYFPDPWPKARHAKRRLFQPALFRGIARVLRPGGCLRVASDVGNYFRDACAQLACVPELEPTAWPPDAPDRRPTSYALKYEVEGRSLHYAKFFRTTVQPSHSGEDREVPYRTDGYAAGPGVQDAHRARCYTPQQEER